MGCNVVFDVFSYVNMKELHIFFHHIYSLYIPLIDNVVLVFSSTFIRVGIVISDDEPRAVSGKEKRGDSQKTIF